MKKDSIAVLMTCHNRKDSTLKCLQQLFKANIPGKIELKIYLVDDGSTDGTGDVIRETYPEIKVIKGDGNLFWNGGMRLAWEQASKHQDYDFYFWLNDDTVIDEDGISELLYCYSQLLETTKQPSIIVGSCKESAKNPLFSYGGRDENGPVIPNGHIQECKFINGNAVIIPKQIFHQLGNLSEDYTHAMGDFDYGLRAIQKGFNCYTTRKYIATCPTNKGIPAWCNPQTPLFKRIKLLHSPRGLNLREYNTFRKKFWGHRWIIFAIKAYLKALFPSIYLKLTR